MILEINKLISSENEYINKIGWLVYNREDQNGGLSKNELTELLEFLTPLNFEDIEYEQFEKGKQEGFDEGYKLGKEDGRAEVTMITDKKDIRDIFDSLNERLTVRRGVFSEYD